ncbi:type III-A CRISPR-associated protein Csm2 [Methanothermococcus okinawensis]|uniref:CRISPR system Cms protein Csm2 n=1 Tax=Methanothermococcus okinawensis (strain DSM 14208 / JCM 11175 / IH1) TaxID=647113 RepID=F8AJQ5_METOI|nr:type III-A CRISPR-associated protein Csm2 [Methanothermococcus okinawensis]AEH07253.1 CRISPR-associated protein TM1810 domain protein [Methanothermococcus okinawensis IH1]
MNWKNHPNVKFKNKGGNIMKTQKDPKPKNQTKNQNEMPSILNDKDIDNILNLSSENVNLFIEKAKLLAEQIGDKIEGRKRIERISSSKLRNFYDYAVQIKESKRSDWYLKLMLLKPKMVYNASKEPEKSDRRKALELFNREIDKILNKIDKNNKSHFDNFMKFF